MNEIQSLPYLAARPAALTLPFERYLPQGAHGMASTWVERRASPGGWVLEPIGASPHAVLEMASVGYKVLVAVNNPVSAFQLEVLASAPRMEDFQSVLGELATQKRGNERLGAHILNLYLTRCASCGAEVSAERFFWRRGDPAPYARDYTCPACGDSGEHPVSEEDLERLVAVQRSDPLHRARALERVPGGTREARTYLEEIIKIYAARPLYALFTLINKIEGMSLSPKRRILLDALMLSALDAGHTLWPLENSSERSRALNTPASYVEHNLWLALERAVRDWCALSKPISLSRFPDVTPQTRICLHTGRMRDLVQLNPDLPINSVVCVLPRPNQAFWTLSTLWSAWLWGKENAASLKNVLERQRFDWYWHANALQSALAPAARMVKPGSPCFTLLPEPVAGFVAAAVEAGCASNITLQGLGFLTEELPVQLEWIAGAASREVKKINVQRVVREAVHTCLSNLGEPCHFLKLYTAAVSALAHNQAFATTIQQLTYENVTALHAEIAKVFADRKFLRRLDTSAQDLESGLWWLAQPEGCQAALADRVEMELVNALQKDKNLPATSVIPRMNERFTGLLTPSAELVDACLRSYSDYDDSTQSWKLKPHEATPNRKKDVEEIKVLLQKLAERFGLETRSENEILWFETKHPDNPRFRIVVSASANISRIAHTFSVESPETIFVLPGSRSALLRFKLDQDPYLREKVTTRWHFLKYRALRDFVASGNSSLDFWMMQLDSDPVRSEETIQLSMFGTH